MNKISNMNVKPSFDGEEEMFSISNLKFFAKSGLFIFC